MRSGTFRIAVVGVGKRSVKVLGYLRQAMPELQIVGYVDPSSCLVDKLGEAGTIDGFSHVDEMLARTRPDLLFVGSPNHLHLDHITSGLTAGVRVFSEKPVVASMDQTWRLAQLLQQYGTDRLMVGLVLRYAPLIRDLRKAIDAGYLGRIVSLEANEHIEPQHGGFFMRDWRRHTAFSGGYMLEKCCHDIDLFHMIAGSRPLRVASFGGRATFVPENAPSDEKSSELYQQTPSLWQTTEDPFQSDGDIVDHQNALLEFENGVTMSFHTNTNVPDQSRYFCIAGTKGMAEGDLQRGYFRVTDAHCGKRIVDIDYTDQPETIVDHYGSDRQMAVELAEHLRGAHATLPVSAVNAIEAGVTAMAVDEARISRKMVDLTKTWTRLDSYQLRKIAVTHAV